MEKLPTGVDETFVDNIQSMATEELKATIVRLQLQNHENEEFKETEGYQQAEAEFKMAKDRHALVVKPVKEVTTSIKNKTKLIIDRLREKGAL